jgi:two-component system response regulator DesR
MLSHTTKNSEMINQATATKKITIGIADDFPNARYGLLYLFNAYPNHFEVLWEASEVAETVELCKQKPPNILILDVHLPGPAGTDGHSVVTQLRFCKTVIKILAFSGNPFMQDSMLKAGADAFLVKNVSNEVIIETLLALSNQPPKILDFADGIHETQSATNRTQSKGSPILTDKEIKILRCVERGWTNESIAKDFGTSKGTIAGYMDTIRSKIYAKNRVDAVRIAREMGLL